MTACNHGITFQCGKRERQGRLEGRTEREGGSEGQKEREEVGGEREKPNISTSLGDIQ